jgi:hypothetical protein
MPKPRRRVQESLCEGWEIGIVRSNQHIFETTRRIEMAKKAVNNQFTAADPQNDPTIIS